MTDDQEALRREIADLKIAVTQLALASMKTSNTCLQLTLMLQRSSDRLTPELFLEAKGLANEIFSLAEVALNRLMTNAR